MKKAQLFRSIAFISLISAAFGLSAQTPHLMPLTSFGVNGDGSIRPGERSYVTDGSNLQRGMAYNPLTGHLIIASRNPTAFPTLNILDGTTGADLGSLPFEQQVEAGNNGFRLNKVGVADDGSIYVGNLTTASTPIVGFVLYRYASEAGAQTLVYAGDPGNGAAPSSSNSGRWGDAMIVRGGGIDTQILLCSQGDLLAILRPTDESLTSFVATTLTADATLAADGLAFGVGDTFWSKAGGSTLRRLSFDLGAGTATTLQTYSNTTFPAQIGPIAFIGASNLLAGIEIPSGVDRVKLYDVSTLTDPIFRDSKMYPTNVANGVSAGEICQGNGNLYALNSDNGVLAFRLLDSAEEVAPSFFIEPAGQTRPIGSNVTFNSMADGVPAPSYQWYFNSTNLIANATSNSLTLSNLQIGDSGFYSVVASNLSGSVTSSAAALIVSADLALFLYEPFDYPAGTRTTGLTLGPGQIWTINGAGDDNAVADTNLTIAGLAPSLGNSLTNGGSGGAARIPFGTSATSGSIYASYAMKIDSIGTTFTGTGLIASFVGSVANAQVGRLLVQKSDPGYILGITKVTTAAGVYGPAVYSEGEIVFVVIRYTFSSGSGTDDVADLWLNPDPATFSSAIPPDPTVTGTLTGTDPTTIDMYAFRQNSAANTPAIINYDELRVGRTWAAVTPLAAGTPVILTIARDGTDVVISWPTEDSAGFNLESTSDIKAPITWSPVGTPIVVQGSNNTVTIPASADQKFYQLRK